MTPSYVVRYAPAPSPMSTVSAVSYPCRTMPCTPAGRSRHGVSISNGTASASASRMCVMNPMRLADVAHGWIAPSASERRGFGTMVEASIWRIVPRPWQASHAPCGELNEKLRGSSAGTAASGGSAHANDSEKRVSSFVSASRTIMEPSPFLRHNSTESARRERLGLAPFSRISRSLTIMRSTTMWTVCAVLGSSSMSSSTVATSPSTIMRTNPSRRIVSRILLRELLSAEHTVHRTDFRPEQAHIIVDFRDGSDGGTRVPRRGFLVDRDRGAGPLDALDVRLFHLGDELARVCGEALDVPPLSFRENRVERKGGLSRAGKTRNNRELVAGDVHVDALQIVHAGAADLDAVCHGIGVVRVRALQKRPPAAGRTRALSVAKKSSAV